ncbi:MAG TPA: hypothetical protein VK308_10760 [Pyrinomonadaceae bacterium]|nr:hypothetical protein [Pyrinomonadaceae bacterium]
MKRKLLIGIVSVMVLAFGVGTASAKADLSGVWTLDVDKSEGMPPGLIQIMTVTQKGDHLEIETRSKVGESGPERVGKDAYVLDGKENDFTTPLPPGAAAQKKSKRSSKWIDDVNGFDVSEESVVNAPDGSEATIRTKRRWRLSADGKTLTVEMETDSPRGMSKSRRVFVKK